MKSKDLSRGKLTIMLRGRENIRFFFEFLTMVIFFVILLVDFSNNGHKSPAAAGLRIWLDGFLFSLLLPF